MVAAAGVGGGQAAVQSQLSIVMCGPITAQYHLSLLVTLLLWLMLLLSPGPAFLSTSSVRSHRQISVSWPTLPNLRKHYIYIIMTKYTANTLETNYLKLFKIYPKIVCANL